MEIVIAIFGACFTIIFILGLIISFFIDLDKKEQQQATEEIRHLNATQWALYQTQLTGSSQPIKGNNLSLILSEDYYNNYLAYVSGSLEPKEKE
jgi:predicted permease